MKQKCNKKKIIK